MKKLDVTDNFILFTIVVGVMLCAVIYFLGISKQPTNDINRDLRIALVGMLNDSITLTIGVLAGRAMEKYKNINNGKT